MQLKILKINTVLCISLIAMLTVRCAKKNNLEDQITVTVNLIDSKTKLPRVNAFDTIDVRIAEFGIPMRKYVKTAEYITDSTGSIKVKLDRDEEYHFIYKGSYIYGATEFSNGELKDGQEIDIEVMSLENR